MLIRNLCFVILAYLAIGTYAFTGKGKVKAHSVDTAITGRVSPADGVNMVWVVSGKDSLKSPTSAGLFTFSVKPGVHQLVIDAKAPYKDVVMDNLNVTENEVLDVGEIVLKQ
jgi:hypothetical protein